MKLEKFIERNKVFPIYKGEWNEDHTKITYWFEGAGRGTLKASEVKAANPRWKGHHNE